MNDYSENIKIFKSNINRIYAFCRKEHEQAVQNLASYLEMINKIINRVNDLKQDDDNEGGEQFGHYIAALTKLSKIADTFRTFNLNVSTKLIELNDGAVVSVKSYEPTDQPVVSTESIEPIEPVVTNGGVCNVPVPVPEYCYKKPDISKYKPGFQGTFCILSIKDKKNRLVYLMDLSNDAHKEVLKNVQIKSRIRYPRTALPKSDVVFAVDLDGYLFRAVRQDLDSTLTSDTEIKIFLLETGEELSLPQNELNIFELQDEFKFVPSQALLCSVVNQSENVDHLLTDLYSNVKGKVLAVKDSILHIIIDEKLPCPTPPSLTNGNLTITADVPTNKRKVTLNKVENGSKLNPNAREFSTNGYRSDQSDDTISSVKEMSPKLQWSPANDTLPTNQLVDDAKPLIGKDELTAEQIASLYEEPVNTSNVLKAVLGYAPKDDGRICKFYNPITKGCFKGSNCTKEHVQIIKEGWTRDREPTKISIPAPQVVPAIHTFINLTITHIVSVQSFYAQLNIDHPFWNLKQIVLEMNSTEQLKKCKELKRLPVNLELVTALYTDGLYYRARVITVNDPSNIKVQFCDYGNCSFVSIDKLRQWNDQYDGYPFQAIHCILANVQPNLNKFPTDQGLGIKVLKELILNKKLPAYIIDNSVELRVLLKDDSGKDIGDLLCEYNLALKKEVVQFISIANIPG